MEGGGHFPPDDGDGVGKRNDRFDKVGVEELVVIPTGIVPLDSSLA